ncbi:MAG: PD-(D/E)XK nuclease family protein [Candidatus Aminicenantaceae bacterium]
MQSSRPLSYMAEVGVDYQAESDNIILHVQGRIDGIYEKEDQVVIEEIKTSTTELENFIEKNSVLHWAQVKIYAAIFAYKRQLSELHIQLTYFQLETQETKILNQQFKAEELNIFLQTTTAMYLEWLDKIELWPNLAQKG